jgi:hypothetical protein
MPAAVVTVRHAEVPITGAAQAYYVTGAVPACDGMVGPDSASVVDSAVVTLPAHAEFDSKLLAS